MSRITSGGVAAVPAVAWKQVATRTNTNRVTGANNRLMTWRNHVLMDNVTSLKLAYANFYVSTATIAGTETAPNDITVKAWIEYPNGTYTAVAFGGVFTPATIAALTIVESDAVALTIPSGTKIRVWTLADPSTGALPANSSVIDNTTEGSVYGAGATAGLTPATTPASTWASFKLQYGPCAILAQTSVKSAFLLGDSKTESFDDTADATGHVGNLARSIGASMAYINAGHSSDMLGWAASGRLRRLISGYTTHTVIALSINDISAGATLAGLTAYMTRLVVTYGGKPLRICTSEPQSSSSDNWTLLANQGAGTAMVATFNAAVRTGIKGIPYFDLNSAVRAASSEIKWITDEVTTKYSTNDGLHPNAKGFDLIRASGVVSPTALMADTAVNPTVGTSFDVTLTGAVYDSLTPKFGTSCLSSGKGAKEIAVPTGPCTWEVWVKRTGNPAALEAMIGQSGIGRIAITATGVASFNQGAGTAATGTTVITDGNWHHIAGVRTRTQCRLYVDGILEATQTYAGTQNTAAANPMGFRSYGGLSFDMTSGSIDEAAWWNGERYTSNFTPPVAAYTGAETDLIYVWHFDGNAAPVIGPGFALP